MLELRWELDTIYELETLGNQGSSLQDCSGESLHQQQGNWTRSNRF